MKSNRRRCWTAKPGRPPPNSATGSGRSARLPASCPGRKAEGPPPKRRAAGRAAAPGRVGRGRGGRPGPGKRCERARDRAAMARHEVLERQTRPPALRVDEQAVHRPLAREAPQRRRPRADETETVAAAQPRQIGRIGGLETRTRILAVAERSGRDAILVEYARKHRQRPQL